MGFDIAAAASLFTVGTILFGHFEERTAKWRRMLKFFVIVGGTALLDRFAGRGWAWAFILGGLMLGLTVHFVYLRRHGINPWTAEPRDKYYALRGWTS
ncbi:MAG TPA: hypothetical protein VFA59_01850 [Vicinamibacterales bacterium]|nr:hypothetical protein [Vicinamibacterales bacterium]